MTPGSLHNTKKALLEHVVAKGLIALVILLSVFSCSKKPAQFKPELSNITESVYASGAVKAADQYNVYPEVSGILNEIKIKPGDSVKKGQILFVLDENTAAYNTESARLSLELSETQGIRASEKLQEAQLRTKDARDKFRVDSSLYYRQKRLWDQGIGTQLEYDERRLAFISARNDYEIARRQYAQLKVSLRNEIEKARVNYAANKRLEDNYTVRSAISGKVFNVLAEEGELISTQTQLAVIGRERGFLLELQVDENDISRIRLDQKVEISMDSYPDQVFEGSVIKIYPIMNERSRTFQVDAIFSHPPPNLYPNLTAEANIIIRRKENAIVIPRAYLDQHNNVRVAQGEKKKVKTGLRDYQKIEILEGLDTSDVIYLPEE